MWVDGGGVGCRSSWEFRAGIGGGCGEGSDGCGGFISSAVGHLAVAFRFKAPARGVGGEG